MDRLDWWLNGQVGWRRVALTWAGRVTRPRVLILVAGALLLTNILTRYRTLPQPDFVWPALSVLVAVWQLWLHSRLGWAVLTAAAAAALPLYGLSIGRVINYLLPGWWMLITGPADILALALLLSPPIRRWVARQPVPLREPPSSRLRAGE